MAENRKYTKDNVKRAIKRLFRDGDQDEIYDMVSVYGKEEYEREPERVQMAILKLSDGNIEKLLEHAQMAKLDYRDVLSKAEYVLEGNAYKEIEDPYKDLL